MFSILLTSILAAGGSGSSPAPIPHTLLASSNATAVNGRTLSSAIVSFSGNVTKLDWTQVTPGIDGVGVGNDVFRIAILVNEVTACYMDMACDAVVGDYSGTCTGTFNSGDDIDVRIVSMPCLGAPSGFQTTEIEQR